jgi:endonuclease IV
VKRSNLIDILRRINKMPTDNQLSEDQRTLVLSLKNQLALTFFILRNAPADIIEDIYQKPKNKPGEVGLSYSNLDEEDMERYQNASLNDKFYLTFGKLNPKLQDYVEKQGFVSVLGERENEQRKLTDNERKILTDIKNSLSVTYNMEGPYFMDDAMDNPEISEIAIEAYYQIVTLMKYALKLSIQLMNSAEVLGLTPGNLNKNKKPSYRRTYEEANKLVKAITILHEVMSDGKIKFDHLKVLWESYFGELREETLTNQPWQNQKYIYDCAVKVVIEDETLDEFEMDLKKLVNEEIVFWENIINEVKDLLFPSVDMTTEEIITDIGDLSRNYFHVHITFFNDIIVKFADFCNKYNGDNEDFDAKKIGGNENQFLNKILSVRAWIIMTAILKLAFNQYPDSEESTMKSENGVIEALYNESGLDALVNGHFSDFKRYCQTVLIDHGDILYTWFPYGLYEPPVNTITSEWFLSALEQVLAFYDIKLRRPDPKVIEFRPK